MTLINFSGGIHRTADMSSTSQVWVSLSFQIVCEKGTIRLSESGYQIIYEDGKIEEPKPAKENLPTGWHVEIDYFISSILDKKQPDKYLNTAEMRDSIAIIEAEKLSIKEKRSVRVEY